MITKLYQEKLRKDLFRLAVLTVVVVIMWVGLAVYNSFKQSQIKPEVKKYLSPLTPSLDLDTMESIKKRRQVVPENWADLKTETGASEVTAPEVTAPEVTAPEATASAETTE